MNVKSGKTDHTYELIVWKGLVPRIDIELPKPRKSAMPPPPTTRNAAVMGMPT